jgi:ubiquinone biosynthesis protein
VPTVDWRRTSKQVMTSERVVGIPIDERERLIAAGHEPRKILEKAANAFFKQVFRDGFFHADLHPGNLFIAEDGAIVAVDFGIMGRLDRKTRFYLADMLLGFLTGNYRRVAEVHFDAGYVPPRQSLEAFAQACRSIGEPILERPLHEISLARLLAQLFEVTERFEMETQPQLLLLQKTMLVAEGVGRRLDPTVNMWTLARPMIEDWMRENRGLEARVLDAATNVKTLLDRLPSLVHNLEQVAGVLVNEGLQLDDEALGALRERRSAALLVAVPLWLIAVGLLAIAVGLW